MTPPILARVAQLHGSSEKVDCSTISTTTSWEYVSKSSSLSDLTRFGAAFSSSSSSTSNNHHFNNHSEIPQSSVFSSGSSVSTQNNQNNGRGFLPHGVVPMPPPHRNALHYPQHNINGFHGYRLTQKDLLQPQPSPLSSVTPNNSSKDDSNPVMRSTSFNLDCGAARKHTYRFRQNSQNVAPSSSQTPALKGPQQNLNKPIVFVAENPENGSSDVYNVPFQSDIYSLPLDSLASAAPPSSKKVGRSNSICTSKLISSATSSSHSPSVQKIPVLSPILPPPPTTTTKASSSISQHQNNHNQNQRLKLSEAPQPSCTSSVTKSSSVSNNGISNNEGATPPPPQRKNNLNRRRSREDNGSSNVLESCNIKCSPPPPPPPQKESSPPIACKPPQRWSSLAASQPSSTSSPPNKDLPPISTTESPPLYAVVQKQSKSKILPPPPLNQSVATPSCSTKNLLHITEPNKLGHSEKSTNNFSTNISTSNPLGKTLNTESRNSSSKLESVPKKPRSRSVDPGAGEKLSEYQGQHHHIQSIKYSMGTSSGAHQRTSTNNLNYIDNPNDHPLPPEPVEVKESAHTTTADRRNPLGLSFLNLFRRNKNASGGNCTTGKQQNTQQGGNHNPCENEFTSIVPSSVQQDDNKMTAGSAGANSSNNGPVNINNNKEDASYYFRELPPPPPGEHSDESGSEDHGSHVGGGTSPMECRDFAASIERVKDCGWYWGPLSSEDAEDLLRNEPDGSFIVRDSSDARYIFSLTFKLHGLVRHVRIEHDQGNFSFGPLTRFKAATIVDFVEKAVAHSRSGRYLFFLHRRPVLGPMQVQLLHPYSRFMHPRSLKHMCRFVILKHVRRDLIHTLPLPKPLQDYLNTPHYYFEPPDRVKSASGGVGGNSNSTVNGARSSSSSSTNLRNGGGHHNHPHAHSTATNSRVV